MKLAPLRGEIVAALRRLEAAGLVHGTSGNVSARDRETGLIAVSPTSIGYDVLEPGDVSVVSEEGELVEGKTPSTELPMHLSILTGRPEAGAVVHTHSPYATALGLVVDEIPVLSAGDAWAAIVRNHGPVCLGRDLGEALRCAFAVEEGARAFALARAHGEPEKLPEDELERLSRLRQRPRASGTRPG